MKAKFVTALILSVLIPLSVSADIASDMNNPQLSLVAVMQNAIAEGMSVADAVAQMLAIEPGQSDAIVATAMTVAPDDYRAIIAAAVNAGVAADQVVVAALIASDGENADKISDAAIAAAPGSRDAIVAAATRVLPQTAKGPGTDTRSQYAERLLELVAAVRTAARFKNPGGGAASTALQEIDILAASAVVQTAKVQLESDLVAAGFSEEDAAASVAALSASFTETGADVATATASLDRLQPDLTAAIEAAEAAEAAALEAVALAVIAQEAAAAAEAALAELQASADAVLAAKKAATEAQAEINVAQAQLDAATAAQEAAEADAADAQTAANTTTQATEEATDALATATAALASNDAAALAAADVELQGALASATAAAELAAAEVAAAEATIVSAAAELGTLAAAGITDDASAVAAVETAAAELAAAQLNVTAKTLALQEAEAILAAVLAQQAASGSAPPEVNLRALPSQSVAQTNRDAAADDLNGAEGEEAEAQGDLNQASQNASSFGEQTAVLNNANAALPGLNANNDNAMNLQSELEDGVNTFDGGGDLSGAQANVDNFNATATANANDITLDTSNTNSALGDNVDNATADLDSANTDAADEIAALDDANDDYDANLATTENLLVDEGTATGKSGKAREKLTAVIAMLKESRGKVARAIATLQELVASPAGEAPTS